jgi:hypothetical protein
VSRHEPRGQEDDGDADDEGAQACGTRLASGHGLHRSVLRALAIVSYGGCRRPDVKGSAEELTAQSAE